MSINARKLLLPGAICLAFLLGSALTHFSRAADAPPQIAEGAASQVLVQEIRALRRAMQDFTIYNAQTQITLERLKYLQNRVDQLSAEKENVQAQIEEIPTTYQQLEDTAKSFEKRLAGEITAAERLDIEREQRNMTVAIEQNKKREHRLRERDAQLNTQIEAEKAMLVDLQNKLNDIEKAFNNQDSRTK